MHVFGRVTPETIFKVNVQGEAPRFQPPLVLPGTWPALSAWLFTLPPSHPAPVVLPGPGKGEERCGEGSLSLDTTLPQARGT